MVPEGLALAETVPLLAARLSRPLTADAAPLSVSPAPPQPRTRHALLTSRRRLAAPPPVRCVLAARHGVEPATLARRRRLLDHGPPARLLGRWPCRPDCSPPWTGRAPLPQVTRPRGLRRQAVERIGRVAHHQTRPAAGVEPGVAQTAGGPLGVAEWTQMGRASGLLQEREAREALPGPLPPLAMPAPRHDARRARLDRLAAGQALAQRGATLGRAVASARWQAVSPWAAGTCRRGRPQCVEAACLSQQGLPPPATSHCTPALLQDAAAPARLRSPRPPPHPRLAQGLAARGPATCALQPAGRAPHATAAGRPTPAVASWQPAGQRALPRAAAAEALRHLPQGLEAGTTRPDTPARLQPERDGCTTLGPAVLAPTGDAAPEGVQTSTRARALCPPRGATTGRCPVLGNLGICAWARAAHPTALALGEPCRHRAHGVQATARLCAAHGARGDRGCALGPPARACTDREPPRALYAPAPHHGLA